MKLRPFPGPFRRWSLLAPILGYSCFFMLVRIVSVPLRPSHRSFPCTSTQDIEAEFKIRMKNSNFNSDQQDTEEKLLNGRNVYLVNGDSKSGQWDSAAILDDVFKRADANGNEKLDSAELARWIRQKIIEHITLAVGNSYALFQVIDIKPKDGVVSWTEYHKYFLRKRGFNSKYIMKHDERRHTGVRRSIKEQIMRDKASWMEAAKSDPDQLTVDEFLAFTHPESNSMKQIALVDELYDKFDQNGDEYLTEDEFSVLQTQGAEDEMIIIRQDELQRRAEFRKSVDLNGDGKADRRELLHYVAPQSPRHSEHEAEALMALADTDRDGSLSIAEILAQPDLFLRSKMVNTALSFHDEF